ncbi:hypothetical protein [Bremerella cremea]|uniref:hypothetical protein n=1 Tax=Bremerella cremea TaxID=1031537 RepID=UPI0031EFD459
MYKLLNAFGQHGVGCLALILGFFCTVSIEARPWTTVEGKVVEAELVEVVQDGKAVVLDVQGNRFTVSLERLSPQDRGYIQGLRDAMSKPSDAEINKEIDEAVTEDEKDSDSSESNGVRLKSRRVWKSRDGIAVEAQFVRIVYGTILLKEGSRYHRIQYYDLSTDDRQFLFDAHRVMGKESLIPPVRPDLLDPETQQSVPMYQDSSPTPTNTTGTNNPGPSGSSEKKEDVKLPPNGFGSGSSSSVNLPPGGFGSVPSSGSDSKVNLPPSGFGSVGSNNSGGSGSVNLPPSGFGSVPSSGNSGSNVNLPSNGFGSASSNGSSRPRGSGKVGLPSSTIVDNEMPEETESESDPGQPLFDVASIPQQSGGYDALPSTSTSGWSDSPQTITPSATTPTSTARPAAETKPKSSQGSQQSLSEQGAEFNAQMFKPQSDFTPLQTNEPREFTTTDWNMQMFGVTLLGLGSMMIAGGYLWMIALAFLDSLQWGLKSLIPGMAIVYGITEWDKASTPLLTMGLGVCLTLGGFGLLMSLG